MLVTDVRCLRCGRSIDYWPNGMYDPYCSEDCRLEHLRDVCDGAELQQRRPLSVVSQVKRPYWRFRGWWARVECRLRGYPPRPSLEALGFTHVAECAECGHDIFRHPSWTHFGADGKGEGDWDHEATAALGTIRAWPSGP